MEFCDAKNLGVVPFLNIKFLLLLIIINNNNAAELCLKTTYVMLFAHWTFIVRSLVMLKTTVTCQRPAGTAWLIGKDYKVYPMWVLSLHKGSKVNLHFLQQFLPGAGKWQLRSTLSATTVSLSPQLQNTAIVTCRIWAAWWQVSFINLRIVTQWQPATALWCRIQQMANVPFISGVGEMPLPRFNKC
jgi:hypothetical protein